MDLMRNGFKSQLFDLAPSTVIREKQNLVWLAKFIIVVKC